MKVELESSTIKDVTQCNHPAYHDDCLCCMYQFHLVNSDEIKENGLEITIKKHKEAGYFEY